MGSPSPPLIPFGYQPATPPNRTTPGLEEPPWSPGGPGCLWWALLLGVVFVAAVSLLSSPGCYDAPPRTYAVRLVRPDGKTHREYRVHGRLRPWVTGQAVWGVPGVVNHLAPDGWLWDIEEVAEEEAK